MKPQDTFPLSLCVCCMIAAVNGDECDCKDDAGNGDYPAVHPKGLLGDLYDVNYAPTLVEPYFGHGLCDGCDSFLAGDRYEFVGWVKD